MIIVSLVIIVIIFGCVALISTTKFIDPKDMGTNLNVKTRPLSGDYFESSTEANKINPTNGKTWRETYGNDLKEWDKQGR